MKAVLAEVLTAPAYDSMIARAERLAAQVGGVIARRGLPWHVMRVGARCEIMFSPRPPKSGAAGRAHARGPYRGPAARVLP